MTYQHTRGNPGVPFIWGLLAAVAIWAELTILGNQIFNVPVSIGWVVLVAVVAMLLTFQAASASIRDEPELDAGEVTNGQIILGIAFLASAVICLIALVWWAIAAWPWF